MLFIIITAILAGILPVESIPNTDCAEPPTIPYAQIEKTSTTHGSYVTYAFQDTYKLIGFRRAQCLYGEWISMPICNNGKCEEEPPRIQNGRIDFFEREHGSEVRYRCDENFEILRESSVVCNVDKWEGDPPQCQEIGQIHHLEINTGKQNNLDREKHSTTTEVPSSASSSVASDTCYCTYDYPDDSVRAYSGNKPLAVRSVIRKGETVSLYCRQPGMDIVWTNGLAFRGRTVILTCYTCKNWTRDDLPQCRARQEADSFLRFNNDMKILPGGIVEIPRHKSAIFYCINYFAQPTWNPSDKMGTYVSAAINHQYYATFMRMNEVMDSHAGMYDCYVSTISNTSRPTTLILKIADVTCPWFLTYNSLVVGYTNDNKVNSRATFRCDRNAILIGRYSAVCMPSGQWSNQRPTCENYVSCNLFEKSENLDVLYSNDIKVGSTATFSCVSPYKLVGNHQARCLRNGTWSSPLPSCEKSEIQCPPLENNTNRGNFNIHYENNRKVHSAAIYACVIRTQKLIGPTSRECMANGKWSGSYPSCEDITCPWFLTYNSLVVAYTIDNKVNSRATFRCDRNARLIGRYSAVCMPSGQWSNQRPTCEMLENRCPALNEKGIFSIYYDNGRRIGSNAAFHCIGEGLKVSGSSFRTCQENAKWSGDDPTCVDYVSCSFFEESENLDVFYSNDIKVGSTATFSCVSPYTLVGNHQSRCLRNGTWSSALPSCETPKCSVDNLFERLPQEVSVDLRDVTDDYVLYGSELQFVCEPNSFLSGSSKTKCGSQGRWEHGAVRCNEGCTLEEITSTSQLLVETVKDYYLFGEAISFSCPPGQKLSSEIQRVMCLGTSWSDPIPDCEEAPQANPSNSNK